jgi:hypothetical protein
VTIAAAIWSSPGSSGHETGGGPLIPPGSMAPRGAREISSIPIRRSPASRSRSRCASAATRLPIAPTVRHAIRISSATAVLEQLTGDYYRQIARPFKWTFTATTSTGSWHESPTASRTSGSRPTVTIRTSGRLY